MEYLYRVGRSLSILLNALTGGDSNQTFSARNHIWQSAGFPNLVWLIDFFLGDGHCLQCAIVWTKIDNAIKELLGD